MLMCDGGTNKRWGNTPACFYGCKVISFLHDTAQWRQFIRLNNECGVFWSVVFAAAEREKLVIFMIAIFFFARY